MLEVTRAFEKQNKIIENEKNFFLPRRQLAEQFRAHFEAENHAENNVLVDALSEIQNIGTNPVEIKSEPEVELDDCEMLSENSGRQLGSEVNMEQQSEKVSTDIETINLDANYPTKDFSIRVERLTEKKLNKLGALTEAIKMESSSNTRTGKNLIPQKTFTCQVCSKSFAKMYRLNRHVKTVHKIKCELSDSKFGQNDQDGCQKNPFSKRSGTSDSSRPFRCSHENCGKYFKSNYNLNRHIKTHSGKFFEFLSIFETVFHNIFR